MRSSRPLRALDEVEVNSSPRSRRRSGSSAGNPSPRTAALAGTDRFIPARRADANISAFEVEKACGTPEGAPEVNASPAKEEYKRLLARNLFSGEACNRVLSFGCQSARAASEAASSSSEASLRMLYTRNRHEVAKAASLFTGRPIPQSPERILDAPDLLDDYYLNLLDWNARNILAVALGDSVYLWNASTGSITPLMQTTGEGCHVTSIAWAPRGSDQMAIGTSNAGVQIWDTHKCRLVRSFEGHCGRVGVLSWNNCMLSSGSRDATIMHRDTRSPQRAVATLNGHQQEVCGLKWAPNGVQLASGGNDNLLNIWDERRLASRSQPLFALDQHKAAVKALAWCPWQKNLLASGGGTADRMIRFWNTTTGTCLNEIDTHSQVCSLQWSKHDKEIVSSHGYSHNQLILWKYPSMVKVAELTGHTARVLHMAQSPDGTTICSAAADETLRFWKILSGGEASKKERAAAKESILNSMSIR